MDVLNNIKEVAKAKGLKLKDIAEHFGISYVALYRKLNNPKLSTLVEVAEFLNCGVIELLTPSEGFAHFYNSVNGEWLGVRKI